MGVLRHCAGLTLKGDHSTHQCGHGSHNARGLGGFDGVLSAGLTT